ncbi:MAG: AIR synthase, partial [Methanobacteriota archaeon]
MADPIPRKYPMGKVSRAFFENVIARHLGERRKDVAVGPANGVDVGVVRLPDSRAMISTTDPIYIVPQYGWERAAWFAFHILASDLTTSGVAPEYITMDWNLPMDIEDDQIETMLRVMDRECRKYGAAIVTGHTGRYEGCTYPMVGGATFLAIAPKDGWVTADMARPGNRLLVTKTAGLEATAILTNTFPDLVEKRLGADVTSRARALFESMSTVEDALAAASVGLRGNGVWAMHDATEGGVRNAVWEMAQASGVGVDVDLSKVIVDPAV